MNHYAIEYLIGGYGLYSRILIDSGYADNHEDFLSKFWSKYEGMVDCVKPTILHLYLSEKGIKKEIELTKVQKTGK